MQKLKNINKTYIYLFLIILTQIIVSTVFYLNRGAIFSDEILTFMLTNEPIDTYFLFSDYKLGYWWTPEQLIDQLNVGKLFDYKNVILQQVADVHPPLYYMILHTLLSILKPLTLNTITFSLSLNLLGTAYLFNVICFIITQIFMYKTSKLLCKDEKKAIIAVFVYGFTAGCISNLILLRMYSLLTMWVVISTYLHLKLFNSSTDDRKNIRKLTLLTLLITFLGGMTHYYFYIYQCFIVVIYSIINIKHISHAFKHLGIVLLNVVVWMPVLRHVFKSQHFSQMQSALEQSGIERFGFFLDFVNLQLFYRTGPIILIIIMILYGINKKKRIETNNKQFIILLVPTIMSLIIISRIASFVGDKESYLLNQSNHYIYMLYPIVCLIVINLLINYKLNSKIICIFMVVVSTLSYLNYDLTVDMMYKDCKNDRKYLCDYINNEEAIVITDGVKTDEGDYEFYSKDLNIYEILVNHDRVFYTRSSEEIKQVLSEKNNIKFVYIVPEYKQYADQILSDIEQVSGKKAEYIMEYRYIDVYELKSEGIE